MEFSGTAKRNGKIELLRFVFAICVLCYHVVPDAWGHRLQLASGFYLFSKGKLGAGNIYPSTPWTSLGE